MKIPPRALIVFVGAALIAGCSSTPAARIQEKAAVYRALSPEQQQRIAHGQIRAGDSRDMVYIALGSPSEVEPMPESNGLMEKWTYRNFYPSESVAKESLYRKPSGKGEPPQTGSLDALAQNGWVSDASSHGGYMETSGHGSGEGGVGQADVSAATMEVWFRRGRVTRFTLTP